MLKLCASQRARSKHTAMSLAGHAAAVLCLPQTPPHSDNRQTTDRLGCGDALSCYICSQSGTKALQVSHQPCPQDLFCFQFLLAWEQTLSQQSKWTQKHFLSATVRKNLALCTPTFHPASMQPKWPYLVGIKDVSSEGQIWHMHVYLFITRLFVEAVHCWTLSILI